MKTILAVLLMLASPGLVMAQLTPADFDLGSRTKKQATKPVVAEERTNGMGCVCGPNCDCTAQRNCGCVAVVKAKAPGCVCGADCRCGDGQNCGCKQQSADKFAVARTTRGIVMTDWQWDGHAHQWYRYVSGGDGKMYYSAAPGSQPAVQQPFLQGGYQPAVAYAYQPTFYAPRTTAFYGAPAFANRGFSGGFSGGFSAGVGGGGCAGGS